MNNYWTSFTAPRSSMGAFEYHGPWWESGFFSDADENEHVVICAAVRATDEDAAYDTLRKAFDAGKLPDAFEERFCSLRAPDWTPDQYDRFRMADWMKWPWPVSPLQPRP